MKVFNTDLDRIITLQHSNHKISLSLFEKNFQQTS